MSELKINQTLGPTFTRTTSATKSDGSSVASGVVRYEDSSPAVVIDKQYEWDRGAYTRLAASGNVLNSSVIPAFGRGSNATYNGIPYSGNTPRFVGEVLEYGATNLLTENVSNIETNTTGFTTGGSTISRDTTEFWQGSASLKVITNGGTVGEGVSIANAFAAFNGATYTFSVYLKGSGTVRLTFSGAVSSTNSSTITLTNSWTRYSFSVAATSSASMNLFITTNVTQAITFYCDGLQVEQNPTATSWIIGGSNRATTYKNDALFIERGATNIAQYSEQFDNAYWGKSGFTTLTPNVLYAPDGTLTADRLSCASGTYLPVISRSTGLATGGPFTISIYAKAGTANWLYMNMSFSGAVAWFNLADGTTGTVGGAINGTYMTYVGDGWYRCSISTLSATSTIASFNIVNANNVATAWSVTGTETMYFWGAQAVASAVPTSYIQTPSNSSVGRNTEVLNINTAGILDTAQGSIVSRVYIDQTCLSRFNSANLLSNIVEHINGSTSNDRIILRKNGSQWEATTRNSAGALSVATFTNAINTPGYHGIGMTWNSSLLALWIDGVRVATQSNPNLCTNLQPTFGLGRGWDGSLDELNFFNTVLSDSDMAAYTAASGTTIPMRAETNYQMKFNNDLSFAAASGVYLTEWFNIGSSGAIFSGYTANATIPSGCVAVYEFRTSDSDTQSVVSSWTTDVTGIRGKYIQGRITLVTANGQVQTPYISSLTISPSDTSKSATFEEGTINAFVAPSAPVQEELTVTPGNSYTVSTYPTDASSGSVVIEHKQFTDTQADFNTGTLVNIQSLASGAIALNPKVDPTFARTTVATKRDFSTAASGVVRYEDVIYNPTATNQGDFDAGSKTGVITSPEGNFAVGQMIDDFTQDSSFAYTADTSIASSGVVTNWNTANSRLEASIISGNPFGSIVYNNFTAKDISLEAVVTQAAAGGLIARFVDKNNYYLLLISDNTHAASNNIVLYKIVSSSATLLAQATVTFVRGTSHIVRFEISGNELKGFFDGTLKISATDSSFSNAGKVGLYSNSSTTSYFQSFTIDQFSPIFSRASVATNKDGASVDTNIPRYTYGRNLLGNNQSSASVDTGGIFVAGSATITRDTTEFWEGGASFKVVTGNAATLEGITVLADNAHIKDKYPLAQHTVSAYVKGSGNFTMWLRYYYKDGTYLEGTQTFFTATNTWTRRQATAVPTKEISYVQMHIRTNGQQGVTYYVDGLQIEVGSTATTWNIGGESALLVEEPTTNLLNANADNFVSNWSAFGGASVTAITSGQVDPFNGNNAYRIQINGSSGTNVLKYYTAVSTPPATGVYHSLSIWVKNNSVTTLYVAQNLNPHPQVAVTQADGWKLVKIENLQGNGVAGSQLRFETPTNTDNIDCYAMFPQIEAKQYCTSYTSPNTIRSEDGFNLATNLIQSITSGTIIIRTFVDGDLAAATSKPTGGAYQLFQAVDSGTGNNQIRIYKNTTTFIAVVSNGSGTASAAGWTPGLLSTGWYTFGLRFNSSSISIWCNGTKCGELTGSINIPSSIPNTIRLGSSATGAIPSQQWNYPIDSFNYFPEYLDDSTMTSYTSL